MGVHAHQHVRKLATTTALPSARHQDLSRHTSGELGGASHG
jgi:hypothetical protein